MTPSERASREAIYRARADAIWAYRDREEGQKTAVVYLSAIALVINVALLLVRHEMSSKNFIGALMAVFLFKWAGDTFISYVWTKPAIRAMNKRYPKPPPLPRQGGLSRLL